MSTSLPRNKKTYKLLKYLGRSFLFSLFVALLVIPVAEIKSSTITDAYLARFKPDTKARLVDKGSFQEIRYASKAVGAGDVVVKVNEDRPEVTLSRWNEESGITVAYDGIRAKGKRDFLSNTMKWKGDKEEMHAYPLEATVGMEDGGFEIEIELLEPPQTNAFEFRIEGAKDLNFFYQKPLSEESHPGEVCTETTCTDAITGEITRERPESVVGSFAVYHKEKKNHVLGKTNYATGKLFHIYRPRIIDADGAMVWGRMDYKNAKLRVIVPQDFLDTAAYPVIVDPTFGFTSVGSSTITIKNRLVFEYASPASNGTLDSITYYIPDTSNSKTTTMGLYTATSETDVGTIIDTTDEIAVSNANDLSWQTATFSGGGPSITGGTNYFLAVVGSNQIGIHQIAYDIAGNSTAGYATTSVVYTTSPFPSPMITEVASVANASLYGTYTEDVATVLTQNDWRWYANADSVQPGSALASENATTTNVADGDILRLRMNMVIASSAMATGTTQFRLQYAEGPGCTTAVSWSDVVSTSTGKTFEPWVQYNNATPADGATTTSLLLGSSTVLQSYEEANPSAANLKNIPIDGQGEWDWILKNNGAKASTTYCFRMVESDHTPLNAYNSDSYAKLTTGSPAVTVSGFRWRNDDGTEGDVTGFGNGGTANSNPGSLADRLVAMTQYGDYVYYAGRSAVPTNGDTSMRIEKRNKSNGALVTAFDTDGIIEFNPDSGVDSYSDIVTDGSYLYLAGGATIGGDMEWRIEKRDITTGALVNAFDTDGIISVDPTTLGDDYAVVTVDVSHIYIAGVSRTGASNADIRIEKRDKTTGALVSAFGTSGVVTEALSTDEDIARNIQVDDGFIYIGGYQSPSGDAQWFVKKYDKVSGVAQASFGTNGVITTNKASGRNEQVNEIVFDDKYLYLAGLARDQTVPDVNYSMHLEKRNIMTGALCAGTSTCAEGEFGTDGLVQQNIFDFHDEYNGISLHGDAIVLAGMTESSSTNQRFIVEKRNRITGEFCTGTSVCAEGEFATGGQIILNLTDGLESIYDMVQDQTFIYTAGSDEVISATDPQYNLQKRYVSDGSLVGTTTGQATWFAAENASTTVELGAGLRLRFSLKNTGNYAPNQRYKLEIAPKGGGSCEAVANGSFSAVPVAGSCGTSVACMINSQLTHNQLTTPQLTSQGNYYAGSVVENISNTSATTTLFKGQYTELEYGFEFTDYAATSTSYCLRVTDDGIPLSTYTKVAEVKTAGSLLLRNHDNGQVADAFDTSSETNESLYAFKLIPDEEDVTVADIVFNITGAKKINASNFTNIRLFKDNDNDGLYDATDTQVGGAGVMSISGQSGTITFTTDFVATSSQNYLLIADWSAPVSGTGMTLQLLSTNITGTGYDTLQAKRIEGGASAIQHSRNLSGGGGGGSSAQSPVGGDAPSGAGVVTGGNQGGGNNLDTNTGGATIGSEPGYFWPTAQSGSWTNPTFAYDLTNGTYASTNAANTNTYSTFGFGIPAGNRVNGVEVKLEVSGTTAAGTISAELSWDGGGSWTTAKTTPTLTATDVVRSLGGASDTWGRAGGAWTVSHFDTANFRVRLTGAPSSNTVQVDALQVRVYHEATGGGGGGGGEI